MDRYERIFRSVPGNPFRPKEGTNWRGLLTAFANEDTNADSAIQAARDQLFVSKAVGQYLDYLASNLGIKRPSIIAFTDEVYRKFIPLVSYAPKQVKQTIYKVLELFWTTSYLHSTVSATSVEPYDLEDTNLTLTIDNIHDVEVTFPASAFADPSAATAVEIATYLNEWLPNYFTAFADTNDVTGDTVVSIATNTFGLAGSIQITGGTANSVFNFSTKKIQYTKVSLHEMVPNELVVRIPRNVIIRLQDLRWGHHFHADATISDGNPPSTVDPYWPGSFFYDRAGGSSFTLRSIKATLQSEVNAGLNYAVLDFDDVSNFPSGGGKLVFDFGNARQEHNIEYFSRVTNTQLRIDATHIFNNNHPIDTVVHLMDSAVAVPATDGTDYPIFFVDTDIGQAVAEIGILLLKAAGIIVRWEFVD